MGVNLVQVGGGGSFPSAIPNGTTATTQTPLSNDTKVATDAYVDAAVAVTAIPINSVGKGGFVSHNIGLNASSGNAQSSSTLTTVGMTAGQVRVRQFTLGNYFKLTTASVDFPGTVAAGSSFNFGIYDSNGNKLIDTNIPSTVSGVKQGTFTAVTLSPGVYYFAWGGSSVTPLLLWFSAEGAAGIFAISSSIGNPIIATAANALVSGVLPPTLGTLTGITTAIAVPMVLWSE